MNLIQRVITTLRDRWEANRPYRYGAMKHTCGWDFGGRDQLARMAQARTPRRKLPLP